MKCLNGDSLHANQIEPFLYGLVDEGVFKGLGRTLDSHFASFSHPNPRERERCFFRFSGSSFKEGNLYILNLEYVGFILWIYLVYSYILCLFSCVCVLVEGVR